MRLRTFLICNATFFGVLALQFAWHLWRTRRRSTSAQSGEKT